jgi:hypothetical protein
VQAVYDARMGCGADPVAELQKGERGEQPDGENEVPYDGRLHWPTVLRTVQLSCWAAAFRSGTITPRAQSAVIGPSST